MFVYDNIWLQRRKHNGTEAIITKIVTYNLKDGSLGQPINATNKSTKEEESGGWLIPCPTNDLSNNMALLILVVAFHILFMPFIHILKSGYDHENMKQLFMRRVDHAQ